MCKLQMYILIAENMGIFKYKHVMLYLLCLFYDYTWCLYLYIDEDFQIPSAMSLFYEFIYSSILRAEDQIVLVCVYILGSFTCSSLNRISCYKILLKEAFRLKS